jgi:flagellar basal body-associated protein FliL
MKNNKNNRTTILGVVLVSLLIFGYKVLFMSSSDTAWDENNVAGEKAAAILKEVEAINFNTDIVNDQKFKSLNSIESPLPSLPIGKKNPFSASAN